MTKRGDRIKQLKEHLENIGYDEHDISQITKKMSSVKDEGTFETLMSLYESLQNVMDVSYYPRSTEK